MNDISDILVDRFDEPNIAAFDLSAFVEGVYVFHSLGNHVLFLETSYLPILLRIYIYITVTQYNI